MNDNSDNDKVKPENSILRFPDGEKFTELEALKAEIAGLRERVTYLEGFIRGLDRRPGIKETPEVLRVSGNFESRPLPEEDKIIDRYVLCAELVRLLIQLNRETVLVSVPKLAHGDKTGKPRVYFTDDNSFLYFDKAGRLYPGAPTQKCKGKTARYVLGKLYEMRDFLLSPMIQAALVKSQFNAAVE